MSRSWQIAPGVYVTETDDRSWQVAPGAYVTEQSGGEPPGPGTGVNCQIKISSEWKPAVCDKLLIDNEWKNVQDAKILSSGSWKNLL